MKSYTYQQRIFDALEQNDQEALKATIEKAKDKGIEFIDDDFIKKLFEKIQKYSAKKRTAIISLFVQLPSFLKKIYGLHIKNDILQDNAESLQEHLNQAKELKLDLSESLIKECLWSSLNIKIKKIAYLYLLQMQKPESDTESIKRILDNAFCVYFEDMEDVDFLEKILTEAVIRLNLEIRQEYINSYYPYRIAKILMRYLIKNQLDINAKPFQSLTFRVLECAIYNDEDEFTEEIYAIIKNFDYLKFIGSVHDQKPLKWLVTKLLKVELKQDVIEEIISKLIEHNLFSECDLLLAKYQEISLSNVARKYLATRRWDIEPLKWLVKKSLEVKLEQDVIEKILEQLIEHDLWPECDLLLAKYQEVSLLEVVSKCHIIKESKIKELFQRTDHNIELARILLKQIISSHEGNPIIKYLVDQFPELTINDVESSSVNSTDPEILIVLINRAPSDKINLELLTKIFNTALDYTINSRYSFGSYQKDSYSKLIATIKQKKPSISCKDFIISKVGYISNDQLKLLLGELRSEEISEDFKNDVLEKAIKSSSLDNLETVISFVENHGMVVDHDSIVLKLSDKNNPEEYYQFLGKVSSISSESAGKLLKKEFESENYYYNNNNSIKRLDLIVLKSNQPINYNELIATAKTYKKEKVIWLLNHLDNITSQDVINLINLIQSWQDEVIIEITEFLVSKFPDLNIAEILLNIDEYQINLIKFFLAKIDTPINNQELVNKILKVAVLHSDIDLFKMTESKSAVTIDYNSLITISHHYDTSKDKQLEMLKILLAKNANPNNRYLLEIYLGNNEAIRLLIQFRAKLSLITNEDESQQSDYTRYNIIGLLCEDKNYEYLKEYLSEVQDLNKKQKDLERIAEIAFQNDDEKLIELAIDNGLQFDERPEHNRYSLSNLIRNNKLKIVELLVKKDPSIINQKRPGFSDKGLHILQKLIYDENDQVIELLLRYLTADETAKIEEECHLIATTIYLRREKRALLILDRIGNDFKIKDEDQLFLEACNKGMLDLVKRLHQTRNIDLNQKKLTQVLFGNAVISPLTNAIAGDKNDVVEYLLNQSVIVDGDTLFISINNCDKLNDDLLDRIIKSATNITPKGYLACLSAAIKQKKPDLVKKILEIRSIDINILNQEMNQQPENILHLAAQLGNDEIFQLLVNHGFDPLYKDNQGNNTYYHALYYDNLDKLTISEEQFPFEIEVYNDLLGYIKEQPEAARADNFFGQNLYNQTSLGQMAARYACLFDNRSQLESYLQKHNQSKAKKIDAMITTLESLEQNLAINQNLIDKKPQIVKIFNSIFGENAFDNNGRNLIEKLIKLKLSLPKNQELELLTIINNQGGIDKLAKKINESFEDDDISFSLDYSYFSYVRDNDRPLHDLSIFSLPEGKWNKKVWQELAIEHGPKLTKYLFLAQKIEENLGRQPTSLEEVESQAKAIKYKRASENSELAKIFHENTIPEYMFERVLDSGFQVKTEDHIPDIYIDFENLTIDPNLSINPTFDISRYYLKKLPKDDYRGLILGTKTQCCQYVGAEGNDCAIHGMTSAYGGFYVVFKRAAKGRCDNLQNWLENLEKSSSKKEFLDLFKDKQARKKYQAHINQLEEDFKNEHKKEAGYDEIKKILKEEFTLELEGEIIAQSWVWISKNNNLVLDSWERSYENYDILFKPLMSNIAKEVLEKDKKIKKVLTGSSGRTPANVGLHAVKQPEEPMDYSGYRDSGSQYLIGERLEIDQPNPSIRINAALAISDKRIIELENHFSSTSPKSQSNLEILQELQKKYRQHLQGDSR
jgi:hypothetical protein